MNKNYVTLNSALDLIEEADILLIRGDSYISRFIQKAGESMYSHVGLATWHNGRRSNPYGESLLEITEFKEGKGGRTVDLATAYKYHLDNQNIDVYRVSQPFFRLNFDPRTGQVYNEEIKFNGKAITNYMRSLTGLPYGWRRIWWIAKKKIFGIRWFTNFNQSSDDNLKFDPKVIYPVCSTAVSACYSKFGYDLMPNKSDEFIEPADLSRSAVLNYLFTLTA